jgi:GAF domain-containing protein
MRNDPGRLAELQRRLILDSSREQAYDDLSRLLASTLEVPITMVNFLDAERDWFKSTVGLSLAESPVITSFCESFFTTSDDVIIVEDTRVDVRFKDHPLVVGAPFIRFYAAARLTIDGQTLGTLCAYDTRTRVVSPAQVQTLQTLAKAAIELIQLRPASVATRGC